MTTAQDLLNVARSQLGYTEGPNNDTVYGVWYGLNHQPWCGEFVSWCAAQCGAPIPKYAYTPAGANWFKANNAWGSSAQVGAVVFFQWPSMGRICHTGIVETVLPGGFAICIEGNTDVAGGRTGGRVMRQLRHNYIAGFGYPAYDGIGTPAAPIVATVPSQPGKLAVDGEFGPGTKRRLQQSLNTTGASPQLAVDGDFGPASARALQMRLNHEVGAPKVFDGQLGPKSIKALQQSIGVAQDGDWGPATTRALQVRLNTAEL